MAVVMIIKRWNSPRSHGWMDKQNTRQPMDHQVLRRKEMLTLVPAWMNLEMLC